MVVGFMTGDVALTKDGCERFRVEQVTDTHVVISWPPDQGEAQRMREKLRGPEFLKLMGSSAIRRAHKP